MVVKNLPALGPAFHDEGERAACGGPAASLEDEPSGYQGKRGAESPGLDFLEVEAIPAGPAGEAGCVVLPNPGESMARAKAVHERRGAVGGIVGEKGIQVTPVPIVGGPGELCGNLWLQAGVRTANRRRGRLA